MYEKLAGMTGTAETESEEFLSIYNLPVVVIPTNKPMIRDDAPDLVFKTENGKYEAVADEIVEMQQAGRPVLVGTTSIENSERLSELLDRRGIRHSVLNAKQHEREASIVALAGQEGAVTIAPNLAGRGTDIQLGEGIAERGGLHIIGTERHESRRIDNQLRGRAGRQGDPGSSRFYVSLEDELMRRFGSERISSLMGRLGMEENVPIEHRMISKSIENAQEKVEGHNFDQRKHVVQYDDVMNRHREIIYADRKKIVAGEDMHEKVRELIEAEIESIIAQNSDEKHFTIELEPIWEAYLNLVPNSHINSMEELDDLDHEGLLDRLVEDSEIAFEEVEARFPVGQMRDVERFVLLATIDRLWVEHLTTMDDLRQGVGLQAYGQKDPLVVYKTEGYRMFGELQAHIQHDVARNIYRVQPVMAQQPVRTRVTEADTMTNQVEESSNGHQRKSRSRKVGRNDPCPCGSGKKFKNCHGSVRNRAASVA
jgi:preprotein translocase subunit SecA